ncbi:uncharacterized protein LOC119661421 [Hermetia illucens]|nr:uncharacterized protein LOC119661421 [Hermetia illucens]
MTTCRNVCGVFLPAIFLAFWAQRTLAGDSILELMNIRAIEQLLNERRMNGSQDDGGGQFIIQNDLEEDFTESTEAYRHRHRPPQYAVDYTYNGGPANRRNSNGIMIYNDSLRTSTLNSDVLADLQALRSDKILKSSKNALYVTRKEYLKKDWCKTEPLIQRIRETGCITRTIINRFCYGQCNSFYIPKSPKRKRPTGGRQSTTSLPEEFEDEDLTGAAFRSCGFCRPKKFTWMTVTLKCPSMVPQLRKKRVQRIKQCKCMPEPLS